MQEKRISIIGVGNAGCKVVEEVARYGAGGPGVIAVNTDAQALTATGVTSKLQIGGKRTGGLGAGNDPEVGRQAAEDDVHLLRNVVSEMELVIVVAGLGGGTGSGAAPAILSTARDEETFTICVALYPLQVEGRTRMAVADQALKTLRGVADALIVVRNDRLVESTNERTLGATFERANRLLAGGINGLWLLLTRPGCIHLNLADIKAVAAAQSAPCTFAFGEGSGKSKAGAAVAALLANPLIDHGASLERARAVLLSIVGGPELTLKEVGDVMESISAKVPADARIHMGTAIDEAMHGRVFLTAVVAEPVEAASLRDIVEEEPEEPPEPEEDEEETESVRRVPARQPGQPQRPQQIKLRFESPGKGKFKNVEPTILDGQDLDIPTFIRRGIQVER